MLFGKFGSKIMNKLFNGVYRGKKVLVTGHTGFKGSWLSLWLNKLGAEVIGYAIDVPTQPNHFELLNLGITSIMGDVLDKEKIFKTIEAQQPDIVFHLAAQSLVRKSYRKPIETIETNIMGTANILESCRKNKHVKAIVIITSDKCYQNREWARGYKETDALGGDDPYSASNGSAGLIAAAYRQSFFNLNEYGKSHTTLLATARAGNVIGGGDWAADRLIPDIMRAADKNEAVIIRNPHATRPWQHVLEPLSGYLQLGWKLLSGKKEFSDNWNFGPPDGSVLAVLQVIAQAKQQWDKINYEIKENFADFHEAKLLKLDSTKARERLKWKNVWDSKKTSKKTIDWYKNYYQNAKVVSDQDLHNYIQDAKQLSIEWANI